MSTCPSLLLSVLVMLAGGSGSCASCNAAACSAGQYLSGCGGASAGSSEMIFRTQKISFFGHRRSMFYCFGQIKHVSIICIYDFTKMST